MPPNRAHMSRLRLLTRPTEKPIAAATARNQLSPVSAPWSEAPTPAPRPKMTKPPTVISRRSRRSSAGVFHAKLLARRSHAPPARSAATTPATRNAIDPEIQALESAPGATGQIALRIIDAMRPNPMAVETMPKARKRGHQPA